MVDDCDGAVGRKRPSRTVDVALAGVISPSEVVFGQCFGLLAPDALCDTAAPETHTGSVDEPMSLDDAGNCDDVTTTADERWW